MNNPLSARQIAAQWFERVWGHRDESAIAELMAPEACGLLEGGHICRGPVEFLGFFRTLVGVFPDLKVEVLDIVAEEEKAHVRWQAKGTHLGEGMGMKPTGTEQAFNGIAWFVVKEGRIVDGGDCWNLGGLLNRMAAAAV